MWTIVWFDQKELDHYMRIDSAEEVKKELKILLVDDGIPWHNILLFPPDAEMDIWNFLGEEGEKRENNYSGEE